ncbi:MAG TPA: hypothetical protein VE623_03065 [Acidimicrobiales bacterium]|nr:hypothetical protein [Acidimicrobiales bacterium]
MSGDDRTDARGPDDLAGLVGSRLGNYVDLWESANAKLSSGNYHADDLVDDWFRWLGLVSRDTTAAATLILGGLSGAGPGDKPGDPEDEPGS